MVGFLVSLLCAADAQLVKQLNSGFRPQHRPMVTIENEPADEQPARIEHLAGSSSHLPPNPPLPRVRGRRPFVAVSVAAITDNERITGY